MTLEESIIEALTRQGWQRRFIAAEPRLSEAVKMYRDLGFDVHLEPVPQPEKGRSDFPLAQTQNCRVCFQGPQDHYIVFTKPPQNSDDPSQTDQCALEREKCSD